ncbi:MAG TPA: hypothetical protein VMU04_23550 [Candidatus Acidoferrum sp.]|nr:hypothetical protein [Candidatus Acidoferrum sp.]
MIPTSIRQVLSTIQTNRGQALLMGGQACVFYGASRAGWCGGGAQQVQKGLVDKGFAGDVVLVESGEKGCARRDDAG